MEAPIVEEEHEKSAESLPSPTEVEQAPIVEQSSDPVTEQESTKVGSIS